VKDLEKAVRLASPEERGLIQSKLQEAKTALAGSNEVLSCQRVPVFLPFSPDISQSKLQKANTALPGSKDVRAMSIISLPLFLSRRYSKTKCRDEKQLWRCSPYMRLLLPGYIPRDPHFKCSQPKEGSSRQQHGTAGDTGCVCSSSHFASPEPTCRTRLGIQT